MAIPLDWVKNGLTRKEITRLQEVWKKEAAAQQRGIWLEFDKRKSQLIEALIQEEFKQAQRLKRDKIFNIY